MPSQRTSTMFYRACVLTAVLVCVLSARSSAQDSERPIRDAIESVKHAILVLAGGEKSVGIDTASIFTSDYDPGLGIGLRFNQTFHHPFIERPFLTNSPSLQFWGASNDSIDVSVVGIAEGLYHRVPLPHNISLFAGLTGGYYYINRKMVERIDGKFTERIVNSNSFEVFVTIGVEYEFPRYSSVFFQAKYGETKISSESHILLGMNFRTWKREEQ